MQKPRPQAEFHDDIGLLRRINDHIYLSNISRLRMDAFGWYHNLNIIKSELRPLMHDKEREESKLLGLEIKELLNKELNKHQVGSDFNQMGGELYERLDAYEELLRDIWKATGLMLKEPEDMLDTEN